MLKQLVRFGEVKKRAVKLTDHQVAASGYGVFYGLNLIRQVSKWTYGNHMKMLWNSYGNKDQVGFQLDEVVLIFRYLFPSPKKAIRGYSVH